MLTFLYVRMHSTFSTYRIDSKISCSRLLDQFSDGLFVTYAPKNWNYVYVYVYVLKVQVRVHVHVHDMNQCCVSCAGFCCFDGYNKRNDGWQDSKVEGEKLTTHYASIVCCSKKRSIKLQFNSIYCNSIQFNSIQFTAIKFNSIQFTAM